MSVIKKPDLKIFAQDAKTGEVETFPDILRGWGVTLDRTAGKPPLEWFNAIGKRVDEWLMYLTQRGVAEWDTALSYPKTAIVQFNSVVYVSIKETKGEQPDKSQASWSTLGVFLGLGNYYNKTESDTKFQPKDNYIKLGEFGIGAKSSTQLTKLAKDWHTNGFWIGELENGVTMAMGMSVNHINGAYSFNFYARNSKIYYTCTENGVKSKEMQVWTENNFNPTEYALLTDVNTKLAQKQPVGNYIEVGNFGIGSVSSPSLTTYAKDWNRNGFYLGSLNNTSSVVFGISCNHMDGLYALNIYGRGGRVFFSTRENGVDSVVDGTFHTSANTTTDRNGYLRSSTSTVEMQAVPIGSSIIWNSTAPIPENFWPNEGRSFSASEYPELAKILPSLKLPDDRGYAIRIADNGKGIDAGRTVGTYQDCAIENIVGEIHANIPGSASGVFSYRANGSRAEGGAPTGGSWIFDASTQVRTANETRMKNVAKILITRVK